MAWNSYTIATVLPPAELGSTAIPKEIAGSRMDEQHFVFTSSRRGAIFATLQKICACSSIGADLYILEDSAILQGHEICRAADSIQALLAAIEQHPELVLEATKSPHETTT